MNLMVELADYESTAVSEREWKDGDFCVAKYTQDNRWYRARVTKKLADGQYEVHLLDYGHDDTVDASRLRKIQRAHGKEGRFAERCHLAGIMPAGSTDRTKWSNTAKEFVLNQVTGKRLFLKVEGPRDAEYGVPVDINIEETIPETAFDPPTHVYHSLLSLIQDRGLALPMKRIKSTDPQAPTPLLSTQTAEVFNSRLFVSDSPSVESSDMEDTVGGNAIPENAIPADAVSEDAIPEGTISADTTSAGVNGNQESIVIIQPDLEVMPHPPPSSSLLSVLPVYVDYDGVIYAHDFEEEEKAAALGERLEKYAKEEAPEGHLEVKVGQMCVAHFDTDNAWYRARVLEVMQTSAKVKYIDYGNTGTVDRCQLKMITPELCYKPQLAYEFKLHNIKPNTVDGMWPVSFLEYMHKQIVNVRCTAEIKGDPSKHPVSVDLRLADGQSISTILLDIGVVVRENNMEEFYQRSHDIGAILNHSNPYFPLRPGDKGDYLYGVVTHVEMPNLVYIQRCASPDGVLPPDKAEFLQLMEDLNNLPPQTPGLSELPAVGEVCSAMYSLDKRWYRALVVKAQPAENTVLIFYVDYGNSELVPLDRLRVLPARFQDTPAQALRAYLHLDLPDGSDQWTLETYQAMIDTLLVRRHLILIKHLEPLTVELFCEEGEANGSAIRSYQTLINTGLVQVPTIMEVEDENVIIESESEEDLSIQDKKGEETSA